MSEIVLVLKHKRNDDVAELIFKKNLKFAGKLSRYLKNWKLIEVKGDAQDPLVKYMRKQIQDNATDPSNYKLENAGMYDVVAKDVKGSLKQVKGSFNLLPNKIRKRFWEILKNE